MTTTLRTYEENTKQCEFYKEMYKKQDLDFVLKMKQKYSKLDNLKMTMNKALSLLDTFIDPSDPDVDEPNSIHAYQTAERIRKKYPDNKEFQIIGLIHDLGKVLFNFNEPDYAVVGDTYVVGCKLSESMVYYEHTKNHPDRNSDLLGIYNMNTGLNNLNISFGHDEYLYQVLKHNKCPFPKDALYIIRFHSLYVYHKHDEYKHLTNDKDKRLLRYLKLFNKYDLYTKCKNKEVTNEMKDYYKNLVNKYLNGGELFF